MEAVEADDDLDTAPLAAAASSPEQELPPEETPGWRRRQNLSGSEWAMLLDVHLRYDPDEVAFSIQTGLFRVCERGLFPLCVTLNLVRYRRPILTPGCVTQQLPGRSEGGSAFNYRCSPALTECTLRISAEVLVVRARLSQGSVGARSHHCVFHPAVKPPYATWATKSPAVRAPPSSPSSHSAMSHTLSHALATCSSRSNTFSRQPRSHLPTLPSSARLRSFEAHTNHFRQPWQFSDLNSRTHTSISSPQVFVADPSRLTLGQLAPCSRPAYARQHSLACPCSASLGAGPALTPIGPHRPLLSAPAPRGEFHRIETATRSASRGQALHAPAPPPRRKTISPILRSRAKPSLRACPTQPNARQQSSSLERGSAISTIIPKETRPKDNNSECWILYRQSQLLSTLLFYCEGPFRTALYALNHQPGSKFVIHFLLLRSSPPPPLHYFDLGHFGPPAHLIHTDLSRNVTKATQFLERLHQPIKTHDHLLTSLYHHTSERAATLDNRDLEHMRNWRQTITD
ncbi:unnamed protein product [Pleuronectes platessa]|uniref:Uncharacterized protein n=1 Tax=Pleuronectes platessa TaxID=8262 RepID=A0A9N7Z2F4_PLEPL|nr:unnamed protein product [Pleuronectes platessa]